MSRVLVSLLLLGSVACAEDDPVVALPDAAALNIDSGVADAGACGLSGLTPSTETAERDAEIGVLFYTARTAAPDPFDLISIDFYFPLGATDGTQNFVFTGEDLADCHTCVMLRQGCSGGDCLTAKSFLAQSGALSISSMGAVGQPFTGSLTAATFSEVTVNWQTQEATPVPGGQEWCIDAYSFDVTVTGP